jgi:tripartite-type tricarboxylate transporter receptor subunit TctC
LGLSWLGEPVWAQTAYPSQPIRFLVPFTAGSGTDVVARTLADQLVKTLGQPVITENKPGAGGTVGAAQVASAPADGHTVLIHSAAHVANAALYPKLRYDTLKDFVPVTMLAALPNVLVTAPGKDIKTVQELVQKARANPGKYTYGSAGNGSATHMNAEKFRAAVGIEAVHVPFKGTPEALTELMAGRLDWFFAPLVTPLPLI